MKKNQRLATYSLGSGRQTIVFLHGFLASSRYWRKNQKELAKRYSTLAVDLLGFGRSPKPKDSSYDYDDHLSALHHTLEAQKVDTPMILVGHSMGALLALRYASKHPDKVASLHLFNPPLFLDQHQARENLRATGKIYRAILYSRWRRWFWRGAYLLPFFYVPTYQGKSGHVGIMRHTHLSRERSLQNIIEKQQSFRDLYNLSVPAKLVVSRYDRYAYQQNLALHDLPKNIEVIFKDSDHHFPIRYPEEVVEIIAS